MLSDREFTKSVVGRISAESVNAEWALEEEAKRLIGLFDARVDPYLQARAEDEAMRGICQDPRWTCLASRIAETIAGKFPAGRRAWPQRS